MASNEKVEFLAYLPPIQTALTVSGDGDLMRVKFDINLSISPDAIRLLAMTGKRLKITVKTLTDFDARKEEKAKDDEIKKEAKGIGTKTNRRRTTNRRDQRAGG